MLVAGSFSTMRAKASAATPNSTATDLWQPDHVPFSFVYDGKPSAQWLPGWQISHTIVADAKGEIHRTTYTDPATHLTVMADVRVYPDFPDAVDWVIRFRNDGSSDTPILENILPLDGSIAASDGDVMLRHARGSNAAANDFEPLEETFGPGGSAHMESLNGDSSNTTTLPFFNLQTGDHGLVGAIGWTGNWKADFQYAGDGKVHRAEKRYAGDPSAPPSRRRDSHSAHCADALERRKLAGCAKPLATPPVCALHAAGTRQTHGRTNPVWQLGFRTHRG